MQAYVLAENWQEAGRDANQARQLNQNDRSILELLQRIERGQKMASRKDYYKILGLSKVRKGTQVGRLRCRTAEKVHGTPSANLTGDGHSRD